MSIYLINLLSKRFLSGFRSPIQKLACWAGLAPFEKDQTSVENKGGGGAAGREPKKKSLEIFKDFREAAAVRKYVYLSYQPSF